MAIFHFQTVIFREIGQTESGKPPHLPSDLLWPGRPSPVSRAMFSNTLIKDVMFSNAHFQTPRRDIKFDTWLIDIRHHHNDTR